MNRTTLLFGILAAMFGGALLVTWMAFAGEDDVDPPPSEERSPEIETSPSDTSPEILNETDAGDLIAPIQMWPGGTSSKA